MTASSIRVVAFVGLAILSGRSMALSVPELERLLQASPRESVSFVETRESPWLTLPVQSTGTMRSGPDVLEKRVETPRTRDMANAAGSRGVARTGRDDNQANTVQPVAGAGSSR